MRGQGPLIGGNAGGSDGEISSSIDGGTGGVAGSATSSLACGRLGWSGQRGQFRRLGWHRWRGQRGWDRRFRRGDRRDYRRDCDFHISVGRLWRSRRARRV